MMHRSFGRKEPFRAVVTLVVLFAIAIGHLSTCSAEIHVESSQTKAMKGDRQ
jgi:hypothetical protein